MKILFVSLFFPLEKSYHAGGRYVYELLRTLSQRHEIYLATRLEEGELPYLEALRPLCREIYPFLFRGGQERRGFDLDRIRRFVAYLRFSRFADRLVRENDFDLVQVEWVPTALLMRRRKAPMVLDAHDVITKSAQRAMVKARGVVRLLARLKYLMVKAIECRIMKNFDTVLTVSEFDRRYLLDMLPTSRVRTAPIPAGMDLTDRTYDRRANTILFLASYKYRTLNVEAALYFYHQVFLLVKRRIPDAQFIIAGAGPPDELTSVAEKDPQVTVTGFVDDTDRYYKEAAVFVAPILVGGGIIVKVLDAMAAGTPVVTTSYGNEGVGAVAGRDLLVADEPEGFAAAVIGVLRDQELAGRLGACGQAFVREHYGREAVFAGLEAAYGELARNGKREGER